MGDAIHFMFGSMVGFSGPARIKWRYFRFEQIQDGGHDMTWHDMTDDIDKSWAMSLYTELLLC